MKETTWETGADKRAIIKCTLKNYGMRAWIGLIWLRIVTYFGKIPLERSRHRWEDNNNNNNNNKKT
jgi:hypothetical protein